LSKDVREKIWSATASVEIERTGGIVDVESGSGSVPLKSLLRAEPETRALLSTLLPPTDKERIRQLEEMVQAQKQMIDAYRKINETDEKIIALLQESGPGSAAMEGVKLVEEVQKLRAENATLREWLNAEEVAAVAHGKAAELRERVSVIGMRKENAEGDE